MTQSGTERLAGASEMVLQGGAAALTDADISVPTELVQLRVRVIALENLVIALLAQAPSAQLEMAREMADYISPRPGHTAHPLTLRAADEMRSLVARANQFRAASAGRGACKASAPHR